MSTTLVKDRAGSALYVLLLMGILVLEFGALAVLKAEKANPDANIKTAADAVWYVIVTISTVGYGDRYPTTSWGRIDGTIIILVGVGIFGTFTGFLANFFLSPPRRKRKNRKKPRLPHSIRSADLTDPCICIFIINKHGPSRFQGWAMSYIPDN